MRGIVGKKADGLADVQHIYHAAIIQKHIDIKCFKDKSFIHENAIAYLHKYIKHINHLFKVYYL